MIRILSRIFLKNPEDTENPKVRTIYGVICGGLGIFLNLLLFTIKLIAGILSKSVSVTADAMNNLSDSGSSIVTMLGFKLAAQKPDPHHPFGHGRMEYLSGLIVSFLILMMGSELLKTSVQKIIEPETVEFSPGTAAVLVISIAIKLYMAFYNRRISKKIQSSAMAASAIDSISDCAATTVVLLSMILSQATGWKIDGYCGAAVSAFVLISGIKAAKETINPLLGQPPSEDFVEKIRQIVSETNEVIGMHDLIVHDYGPGRRMISLHAEVPEDGDLLKTHDAIDNLEKRLAENLGCSAVIHMDPIATDNEQTLRTKQAVIRRLHEAISTEISIHDFRIVQGPTHTNLIFDLAVPFSLKLSEPEIIRLAEQAIHLENENWFAVISVDRIYA